MIAVLQHEPALRFKDELGKDYPDWEKKQFSDIAKKVSDSYSPEDSEERFECIELESLSSESGQVLKTFNSREQKSTKTKFVKGDVLFGKLRPYLKKYHRAQFDGVCTSEIWVLRPKAVSSKFLYSLVQGHLFYRTANIQSGSKMPRSDWNIVSQSSFMIPFSSDEQQKIAAFLSLVDTKIEQLSKKKSLLEQYKKGMMQKLFSQEIRFKDEQGKDYPKWEAKTLGDISKVKRGASPRPISSPKWFSEDSSIGWVRISDVTNSYKYLRKTTQHLSNEGVKRSRFIPKGNMIMSICATIGKPIHTGFDVCIHDGFVVFEDLKISKEYLYYFLEKVQKRWYRYGQPGTQVNLNSGIVSNEKIKIPEESEQQKIASFLSAIDRKIEFVTQQIKQAQTFKKGLLQQMFI